MLFSITSDEQKYSGTGIYRNTGIVINTSSVLKNICITAILITVRVGSL